MKTPGGGGYGTPSANAFPGIEDLDNADARFIERGSVYEYRMNQESV